MPAKQKIVLVLTLASSLLLLLAALLLPWWTGALETGSFRIDPRSMSMCLGGVCRGSKALSQVGEDAAGWSRLGSSVFAASLVASATLMLSALRTFKSAGQRSSVHWLAGLVSTFAGLLSLLFVWLHPDFGDWTPSYGMACALAGAFVGALAASAASRQHQG